MIPFWFPINFSSLDAANAFHHKADFIWLDSNKSEHPQNRYSYIVFDSIVFLTCLCKTKDWMSTTTYPHSKADMLGLKPMKDRIILNFMTGFYLLTIRQGKDGL